MESTSPNRTTATLVVQENGTAEVTIGDNTQTFADHSVTAARETAISIITAHATLLDRPITVSYTDPDGSSKLIVSKDGSVRETARSFGGSITISTGAPTTPIAHTSAATEDQVVRAPNRWVPTGGETDVDAEPEHAEEQPAPVAEAAPVAPQVAAAPQPVTKAPSPAFTPAPVAESNTPKPETTLPADIPAETRAETRAANRSTETRNSAAGRTQERQAAPRRSFIEDVQKAPRAETGFRGALAKLGFNIAPSASEAAEREDVTRVSQHWPGPRTIAIVNGKGGASKTPTTAMLSAVFARHGGSGVLAWDNNETRGTLGWRTEQGQHDATVQNLLPNAEGLMDAGAQASDLTRYLHHQVADKYDVLRSNPNILAEDQRLTMAEFDALHAVATKYFRLIFIDSGNDESADRWRRMIDRADQIVIATTARGEHAEAGALLLEALRERGDHGARLAETAMVVVSQADHKGGLAQAETVADGFRSMARDAVVIPFDPAMRAGKLQFDALKPETQRAWLAAAASVARGL